MYQASFSSRLLPGERIIWTGQPSTGLLLTSRDTYLIPFSLVWFCFTVVWETAALTSTDADTFFVLWGAMFMGIGLYMVVGRFVSDAWIRSKTSYALTDQRVLIARSAPFAKFIAVNLARLSDVQLTERSDGTGTVRFGPQLAMTGARQGFGAWSPALDPVPQFLIITDARRVFDLVQHAAAKR